MAWGDIFRPIFHDKTGKHVSSNMIDKTEIERAITAETATILGIDDSDVTPHTKLESLGIDSIRLVELLIFIEKQYGIRLMDAGLDRNSLRDASSLAASVAAALEKKNMSGEG